MGRRISESRKTSSANRVFVSYLPPDYCEIKIAKLFEFAGPVAEVKLHSTASRTPMRFRCGYVFFRFPCSVQIALRLNGHVISTPGSKYIIAVRDAEDPMPVNRTNLVIKNLAPTVSAEDVYSMFTKFGKITSYRLLMDENGTSRCISFVNYSNHEDAETAIQFSTNSMIHGRKISVSFALRNYPFNVNVFDPQEVKVNYQPEPFSVPII